MAAVGKVFGVDKVVRGLARAGKKHKVVGTSVIVAYTAAYALHVHENLAMPHKEGKEAKFLEKPMRELANSGELASLVTTAVKGGASIMQGLLIAGQRLQRESQLIVPRDTSHLAGSATTRIVPPDPHFEGMVESQNKRAARKAKKKAKM